MRRQPGESATSSGQNTYSLVWLALQVTTEYFAENHSCHCPIRHRFAA